MKQIYLFPLLKFVIFLAGCGAMSKKDPVRSFIPGKYAKTVTNEFSKGNDTLLISVLSREGNSYLILRKLTYQRIKEGKLLKRESKQENWIAMYNEQEKLLHETQQGKLISFHPENGSLMVGSSEYKKVD